MLSWPRSRKYSEHFLEIPKSTNPLLAEHISPPRQIAYYSHFPEATVDDYRYQSSDALKLFNPPSGSFKITGAISKPDFSKMCDRVDPLLRQDLLVQRIQPVVTSCERANRYEEIENADIITRRGVMVEYVYSLISPTRTLTWFNPAWQWVKRPSTTFSAWIRSCISAGKPSLFEMTFHMSSFH